MFVPFSTCTFTYFRALYVQALALFTLGHPLIARLYAHAQRIAYAYQGDAFFCTRTHEQRFLYCNSCVQCSFLCDDDAKDGDDDVNSSYGIITDMYYHKFCSFLEPKVVIVGDWYMPTGFDNSGLLQVS